MLAAPALRAEVLRVLQTVGAPALAAVVGREAERLVSQLRGGANSDPSLARLVVRLAESAVAATLPVPTAGERASRQPRAAPLLADVLARLVEVAPDRASVAAARAAAARLIGALTPSAIRHES